MNRRDFLIKGSFASLALTSPWLNLLAKSPSKILILIELKGGNDGLNTFVPFFEQDYYRLRPSIAIKKDQILKINEKYGLNPELKNLYTLYKNNELSIIQGVGYENPNLSHFRSIEIWDTASKSNEFLDNGWLASPLKKMETNDKIMNPSYLIIGDNETGPLTGIEKNVLVIKNTKQFLRQKKTSKKDHLLTKNESLNHVLQIQNDIQSGIEKIKNNNILKNNFSDIKYPKSIFGKDLKTAIDFLSSSNNIPVIKLSLSGFDTHTNQTIGHRKLLKDLDEGIKVLKKALKKMNKWENSLIMTYSEFGRRVKENGSKGTDHGTSNIQFITGGAAKGGLVGKYPSLKNLENGNLMHHVDFKSVYSTVLAKHFNISTPSLLGPNKHYLNFIK